VGCLLYRSAKNLKEELGSAPLIVTVGNFDGMHRGHESLLAAARALQSEIEGSKSVILTFYPHPRFYFKRQQTELDGLLTSIRIKLLRAGQAGISAMVAMRFNADLVALSPEDFIRDKILALGNVQAVVVGQDWCFGKDRAGNAETLREIGARLNFKVRVICDQKDGQDRISSSLIRNLLREGDMERAQSLLGEPYMLTGKVIHGDKRGTKIGFPTANVIFRREQTPKLGVYSTLVTLEGRTYNSITNVGVRPTFQGPRKVVVETHILDGFSEQIYGKRVYVEFLRMLRPEMKFASVDELTSQIQRDILARESNG